MHITEVTVIFDTKDPKQMMKQLFLFMELDLEPMKIVCGTYLVLLVIFW